MLSLPKLNFIENNIKFDSKISRITVLSALILLLIFKYAIKIISTSCYPMLSTRFLLGAHFPAAGAKVRALNNQRFELCMSLLPTTLCCLFSGQYSMPHQQDLQYNHCYTPIIAIILPTISTQSFTPTLFLHPVYAQQVLPQQYYHSR